MIKSDLTFSDAIAQFDRSPTSPAAEGYRAQRAEILKRFPLDKWPAMRLEDYALGQPGVKDTYCRWLEFKSQWVGSIRGGSAGKLIIFKRRDREGWYFPNVFSEVEEAWTRLRSEFVEAFELAARGDWERIDDLETLGRGPAVKLKSLHVYFPDEVLPVCSTSHLRHFLRALDRPSEAGAPSVVALNRFLLAALRGNPALEGWNTEELQRLLYEWRDPRGTQRVLKIAPGENAKFWDDCLRGATSASVGTKWAISRSSNRRRHSGLGSRRFFLTTGTSRKRDGRATSYGPLPSWSPATSSSPTEASAECLPSERLSSRDIDGPMSVPSTGTPWQSNGTRATSRA